MYIIYRTDGHIREYFYGYHYRTGNPVFISEENEAFFFENYDESIENLNRIRVLSGKYAEINVKLVRDY